MKPEPLVHKANQIALFFSSSSPDAAVAGIADHIRKFWTPSMRRALIDYARDDGRGLHALVPDAVKEL